LEAAPTRFCCRASSCSRNECRMAKVIHRWVVAEIFRPASSRWHTHCHTTRL
jgi:hypothetical protein